MYEEYFGLDRPPFKITPDTSLFYEGGKRGDILAALVYAIHRGEGIIKVVGEVGSGKTMLCRMLQLKLPDSVEIVYIANPSVSPQDILFVIAHELSLPVSKEASKHEVMHQLHDYLLQRHMENKQVVLFIEEAQGMPLETLEEIRLLSNLETDEHKLLQIILFGQPELDQNLSHQSIRQLRERITHNFNLEPLSQDEIHNYLNFRMREVGYTGPELINRTVAKKIEHHSDGLLRRINIIADKILLSAFAEGTHNLGSRHVTAAVNDSAFDQQSGRGSKKFWWLGLVAAAAFTLALLFSRSHWMPLLTVDSGIDSKDVAALDRPAVAPNDRSAIAARPEAGEYNGVPAPQARPDGGETSAPEPHGEPAGFAKPTAAADLAAKIADSAAAAAPPAEPSALEASLAATPRADASDGGESQAVADVDRETEMLMQQVEAVVQEVEAAVQQAGGGTSPEVSAEDLVLQKALDQASASAALATRTGTDLSLGDDYSQWLEVKLKQSLEWLSQADRDKVSIQVLMRSKSAARELVYYLRNEWPLDISKTYLYEVSTEDRNIYRVFYSEFDNLSQGRDQLERLPESVKVNSPYLHSVYRMQKALL